MKKIIFILVFILFSSGCAQFQDVFSGGPVLTSPKTQKTQTPVSPSSYQLAAGQRAPIVTKKGTYYFVTSGDTIGEIANRFKITKDDLAQVNNLYDSTLEVGRRLFIPNRRYLKKYLSVTQILKDEKIEAKKHDGKLEFIWPVKIKDFVFTSPFGMRRGRPHDGIDLSAKTGTPIYAAAEGKVIYVKRFSGYGKLIVVKHAKDYFTAYAHCHQIKAKLGDHVKQGQKIGTVGRTGRSTGPHLHFEVHKGVDPINPLSVLPKENYKKR